MTTTIGKSEFAIALEGMLDQTNLLNRKGWAYNLWTTEEKIADWLEDKAIPESYRLHMVWDILGFSTHIPEAPLIAFKAMAERRATEVSPLGKRMLPTVWEYMMRPCFNELSSTLAKLSPDDQEKLLEKLYP